MRKTSPAGSIPVHRCFPMPPLVPNNHKCSAKTANENPDEFKMTKKEGKKCGSVHTAMKPQLAAAAALMDWSSATESSQKGTNITLPLSFFKIKVVSWWFWCFTFNGKGDHVRSVFTNWLNSCRNSSFYSLPLSNSSEANVYWPQQRWQKYGYVARSDRNSHTVGWQIKDEIDYPDLHSNIKISHFARLLKKKEAWLQWQSDYIHF